MRSLSPVLFALLVLAALSACTPPAGSGIAAGRAASEAGNYGLAVTLADSAIAQDPANVEGYILRADARRRMIAADSVGRVDSVAVSMALADAQRASALAPENVNARNALTNFWITSMNRGARAYGETPPDFTSARVLFRAATLAEPDSAQSLLNYALSQYASGNAEASIAPYRAALAIEPDAATQRRLARALMETSQGTEAVSVLEAASTQYPNDPAIRADLFAAYEATGRGDQALARYETELRSATPETEPAMRLQYGVALLQADRVDDAIRELTRAAELSPNDATTQYNLGAAIQNKGARLNTQANATTDNAENARLVAQRNEALEQSVPYFERARTLSEGEDQRGACVALFRVYTTLGRIDDARTVSSCAGIDMN